MAFILFFETLLKCFHQLFPAPQSLNTRLFLFTQSQFKLFAQPLLWYLVGFGPKKLLDTFEMCRKGAVETVEMGLILDQPSIKWPA